MRVAVIDLGTNTFHLLLAEVNHSSYEIFHRDRKPVKIGEKGINKGEITTEAWKRAIDTLKNFKRTIDQENIDQLFATATSAIRNASNGQDLVSEIKKVTSIEVEVISGLKEAELIHLGAKEAMQFGTEKNLIMDIGGGSIEFIIADDNQTYWMHSFEIGGQRLIEMFHKSDPINRSEIEDLHQFFNQRLELLFDACNIHHPKTLIGCSGTFDTLSDIYCERYDIERNIDATEYPLTLEAFTDIYQELIHKKRKERLAIPGMIEMRVDMIVVACVLVNFVLSKLDIPNIRVSAYALKEGILFNVLRKVQAI